MSDAITLDVLSPSPVQLDVGDADPIARQEIAALSGRVTTVEGDVSGLSTRMGAVEGDVTALDGRMDAAEGALSTLGTTVDGIDARVEAIEADGSVTTAKLADGSVTPAKLADTPLPSLLAGAALSLTGNEPTEATFLDRACPGTTGQATVQSVRGNTLRWNQLAPSIESASWRAAQNTTASRDGGKITATVTEAGYGYRVGIGNATNTVKGVKGHKYLASYYVLCDKAANFGCDALNRGSVVLSACTAGVRSHIAGIFDYPTYEALAPNVSIYLCAMTSMSAGDTFTIDSPQLFDLTAMFGAGNEPQSVAEFEALFPEPYYPYDAGSLLPVRMEGVETTGKNLFYVPDVTTSASSYFNSNGVVASREFSTVGPLAPGAYTLSLDSSITRGDVFAITIANQDKSYAFKNSQRDLIQGHNVINIVLEQECTQFICYISTAASLSNFQLEAGSIATAYEPYWRSERTIPASTYFPDGMRSAGTVRDELRADAAITRIGERAYQSGDESDASVVTDGTVTHYALATPTTTTIDPPLNLTYRAENGGTERITHTEQSAPPVLSIAYGHTAEGIVREAASAIAAQDGPTATANHAVGSYLTMGGTLYRVTRAIATGEAITPGTNVMATTVMAEVLSLIQ